MTIPVSQHSQHSQRDSERYLGAQTKQKGRHSGFIEQAETNRIHRFILPPIQYHLSLSSGVITRSNFKLTRESRPETRILKLTVPRGRVELDLLDS